MPSILLIDDNPADSQLTLQMLSKDFPAFHATHADSLATYQAALQRDGFNLIVTEYRLNWGDGYCVFTDFNQLYPGIPVVMLTRHGNEMVAAKAMKLGFIDYISKSSLPMLSDTIHQFFDPSSAANAYDAHHSASFLSEKWDLVISKLTSDFAYSLRISEEGQIQYEWITEPFRRFMQQNFCNTAEQLLHQFYEMNVHPDDRIIVDNHFDTLLQGLENTTEYRVQSSAGDIHFFTDHALPIRDWAKGRVIRIYGTIQDVTWRRKAEDKMRLMQRAIDCCNNGIVITGLSDTDHAITYVNQAFVRLTGYSEDELVGHNCRILQNQDRGQNGIAELRHALQQNRDGYAILRNYKKDGSAFWSEISISPVRDSHNRVTHFLGIQNDISSRIEMEAALRISETKMRALFENSVNAIFINRGGSTIEQVNAACLKLWRAETPAQLLAKKPLELFLPDFHPIITQRINDGITGQNTQPPIEEKILRFDGTAGDVLVSAIPFTDEAGPLLFVVLIDISERKQAEAELRASHDQIKDLSQHLETIREEERTRIAREIHDDLGAFLAALKMELSWIKRHSEAAECREKATSLIKETDYVIQSVKNIITDLRPTLLDHLGLYPALEWLVENFSRRNRHIHCVLTLADHELNLDSIRSTAVYRITQEALTNILNHAEATEVAINLQVNQGELVLTIADNGKGISATQSPSGFGMQGMRERAQHFGAELLVESSPESGTLITLKMPLLLGGSLQ